MSANQSGKWGRLALLNAALAGWLIYDISSAVEAPRQAVLIMEYVFLVGVLIGLALALVKLASQK